MRNPRRLGLAAFPALAVTMMLFNSLALHAQTPTAPKPAQSILGSAMSVTRSTGAATVAVMTSASQPKSVRIWEEFNQGSWAKKNRGLVQFVNVSTETEPGLIRTMGVAQFPTVHVYTRGSNGVTRVASFTGVDSAENLVNRLESLNLGLDPISKADQDVRRTSYPGDVHATEQAQPTPTWPQIQACPPAQSPPMAPTVSVAPTFAPTVSTTGGLVQVPGQNLVVQQAPTQVYLAPPQPPMVYVPQTASAAPMAATMTMAQPVAASPPAGNVFMMAPTMPTATAPQPSVMLAASPGQALTVAAPTSVAVAAPTIGASTAAVTNQTLSLPSSGSRTRVRVRGPGFLGSSLARLGERLIQLGRARIETVQETTLEAPVSQSPGVGLTTISTTSSAPIASPPTTVTVPVQQQEVCRPPCPSPPCRHRPPCPSSPCQHHPACPLPSPQGTTAR